MTAPAPTHTRTPTTVTLTESAPVATVSLVDTADPYSPVATGRTWKLAGVAIGGQATPIALVTQPVRVLGSGALAISVTVINTDGTATSTPSNITSTDSVAADATTNLGSGTVIPPPLLPAVYRDATIATPGIPSAKLVYQANTYGSILPAASQLANVLV